MPAHWNGGKAGLNMWPEGDHEGRIHKVPQESQCSSMYGTLTSVYILFCNCNIHALATYVPSYDQQLSSSCMYKFVTVL
jgi:hypothetical protein